eukprot:392416_1
MSFHDTIWHGIISTIHNILAVYKNHSQLFATISKLIQTSPFPFPYSDTYGCRQKYYCVRYKFDSRKGGGHDNDNKYFGTTCSDMMYYFDETGLDDNGGFHEDFVCDDEKLMEHIEMF